ncbi:hypothetical protein [Kitasatospora sp. NPDC127116]|uniref:hypothetical protein n=1 Tax=Kitasatospora sp. NPDC127116 TaxID=3345367 RepID=UPI00363EFCC9
MHHQQIAVSVGEGTKTLIRTINDLPEQFPGGPTVMAVVVAVTLVGALAVVKSRSASQQLRAASVGARPVRKQGGAGPLAVLGVCGLAVSLHGLFGFATTTAKLPLELSIPFMAIFDIAEAVAFISLYRAAQTHTGWTAPMRRTKRLAWLLVAASSAMNAWHAPDHWVARIALGLVPVISAKLIEHELEKKLSENSGEDKNTTIPPGPGRLVELGWLHLWSFIFAKFNLDPNESTDGVPQATRIKRAAREVAALDRAMTRQEAAAAAVKQGGDRKAVKEAQKELEAAERELVEALDRADAASEAASLATDPAAMLTMARHLVMRGRLKDLARMDVTSPMKILTLMEELAVLPGAEAVEASARALEADQAREAAEAARDAALETLEKAKAGTAECRDEAADLRRVAEQHAAEAQAARKRVEEAEAARAELEARKAALSGELEGLAATAEDLRSATGAGAEAHAELNAQIARLTAERDRVEQEIEVQVRQLDDLHGKMNAAEREQKEAADEIRAAADYLRQLKAGIQQAETKATSTREEAESLAGELNRLTSTREEMLDEVNALALQVGELKVQRQAAEEERRAAAVALQSARTHLMDALTAPEEEQGPQWRSEAKVKGWEIYERTVRVEGREPSADELAAAAGRDRTTAQHWLREFGPELARRTAASMTRMESHQDEQVLIPA